MQKSVISVVYHSLHGHTKTVANLLASFLQCENTIVYGFDITPDALREKLHSLGPDDSATSPQTLFIPETC